MRGPGSRRGALSGSLVTALLAVSLLPSAAVAAPPRLVEVPADTRLVATAAAVPAPTEVDGTQGWSSSVPVVSTVSTPAFSDVPVGHPFLTEVSWLAAQGISTGYADGTFHPLEAVSRQAMAAFLYRYAGRPAYTPPATARFSDVPVGSPFYIEVSWLADLGMSTGYADGTFHPTEAVSRQAMAAFLYRFAGRPDFGAPATPRFLDVPSSSGFVTEVSWLASTAISVGYADGTFHPTEEVSRQAMAAFLFRYEENPDLGGADTTPPGPVTGLAVTAATSSTVSLSWSNPHDADFAGVTVRRAAGATAPSSPTAGDPVVATSGTSLVDSGLPPGVTHSYALFARDAVGNYAPAATVTATTTTCVHQPVRDVSGRITADTTWSTACADVYIAPSGVTVTAGVTLTIEPGTVVKGGVDVVGTLQAVGTADDPVVFTDTRDDSVGGDTNDDGDATAPDQHSGLSRITLHAGSSLVLTHVRVLASSRLIDYDVRATPAPRVEITDSDIAAEISFRSIERPVMQRTTVRSPLGGLVFSFVADVTGVPLTGLDRITVVGTPAQRAITYSYSSVPQGAAFTLARDAGVSAFLGGPAAAGTLTIEPGTVVKGGVDVVGTLQAVGTADDPVVFTDTRDDSVGGDTNDDGDATAPDGASSALRISLTGGSESVLEHVLVNHASTGLQVGEFTRVSVAHSKFINTNMAIEVASAGSADHGTSYFYANLPCAPPYTSLVTVTDTWFGQNGLPGMAFDIASLGGTLVDDIAQTPDLSLVYGQMTGQLGLRGRSSDNATSWAYYRCTIPTAPPFVIAFPVTPVVVDSVPATQWLPEHAEVVA